MRRRGMIVVIRYFGGVKLGAGGLIQAYRLAARDAIVNGKIFSKTWKVSVRILFTYPHMNDVMHIIKDEGLRIISQESGEQLVILLEIRKGQLDAIIKKISSLEKIKLTII